MWQDTLLWIAQARLFHPRIQAYVWLVASLFMECSSDRHCLHLCGAIGVDSFCASQHQNQSQSRSQKWCVCHRQNPLLRYLLQCLLLVRELYEEIWRLPFYASLRCPFYLYLLSGRSSGSNRGVTDGLLFAVYGQLLGSMELPTWAVHYPHSF